jgi:hypothetical protein
VLSDPRARYLLYIAVILLLFLSGCNEVAIKTPENTAIAIRPAIHRFDLSARQRLRDFANDFAVGKGGADTGIAVVPGERVEIFASGSASVGPGGQVGPQGDAACRQANMPQPSLPCYAVVYSIGMTGRASVVGAHTGFTATTSGNIFLGVNTPNRAQNSGAFHMTIVTVPAGTMEGLWTAPTTNFAIQGTELTLSVMAFAQGAAIEGVQFTATVAGQTPTTICNETVPTGNSYRCIWNLAQRGIPFQNGPVTFGFSMYGRAGKAVVNPDGVRSGIVRYVETQPNDIYAGYAATDLGQMTASYTEVTARWQVPAVQCGPGETSDSAIWVGMTGISDRSKLAQIATESGCNSGIPFYDAGWEMFPAPVVFISKPVNPGDKVTATVSFQNGEFRLSMDDPNEGWHFATTQPDVASDTAIAECITEAPTVTNEATNQSYVARLSDFGQVSIFCQINANHPIGDGPQNILYQMVGNGGPKATTSDLDPTGATFTVQWHHG